MVVDARLDRPVQGEAPGGDLACTSLVRFGSQMLLRQGLVLLVPTRESIVTGDCNGFAGRQAGLDIKITIRINYVNI